MWKRISGVLGALVLVGSFISGYVWFDTKFAKATDVNQSKIEIQLAISQNKIAIQITQLQNDIRWYQDQMSYIMNRVGVRNPNKLPDHAYRNYKDYENKKIQLERQLNILMRKRSNS